MESRVAMKAAIPQSAQKHGMYRMDPELAVALREGHKDVILGNADSFGADEPNEGNEIALAADFQQLQFVSTHRLPSTGDFTDHRHHESQELIQFSFPP